MSNIEIVKSEKAENIVERIYLDADDKNVGMNIVYIGEDGVYYDADLTKKIPSGDVFHIFAAGVLGVDDGVFYTAKSCTKEGTITFNK